MKNDELPDRAGRKATREELERIWQYDLKLNSPYILARYAEIDTLMPGIVITLPWSAGEVVHFTLEALQKVKPKGIILD